jgi:2-amino-4-hydroxy-6-hydroxymethyldihydropteridine diphosphokinase
MKKTLVLSLGSNLGNRYAYILQAIAAINESFQTISEVAPFYETPPWGDINQSKFINTVLKLDTDTSPEECLLITQRIENTIGRTKTRKWGPRCIDLDLLFYGNAVLEVDTLSIPHPRLHERAFVLKPASEIIPNFIHPRIGQTVAKLYTTIKDDTKLFTL